MIDFVGRAMHISASPGAGKTTLCLGIVSEIILNGGRAIWACRNIPDADRFREILHKIDQSGLGRISILNFSSNLAGEIDMIINRAEDFGRRDIVIVDDWCEGYGRAMKEDISAAKKLSILIQSTNVIITSSSYEDASGSADSGWLARGGDTIKNSFVTVFLLKHHTSHGFRSISWEGNEKLAKMTSKRLEEIVS